MVVFCASAQDTAQTTNGSLSATETNAANVGVEHRPADAPLRALQETARELQFQLEELKIAFRKVVGDNTELKMQLEEKEETVQLLTQNLAVWKTEAELFQKKWEEAQLAARASGVKLMTEGERRLQKQLAESIRRLYQAQQERERLREQMVQLLEVTDLMLQQGDGLDPQLRRVAESQRDASKTMLAKLQRPIGPPTTNQVTKVDSAEFEGGRVMDVNPQLQLVVLNLGRAHGVVVGMPFLVLQEDRVVAQVKVVDVREKISGALIEKTEKSAVVKVGDRAKLGNLKN